MTYIACVFSAFCLVNGIPHFVQGVCGHRFQSPFASPPGVGESSPLINVLWGSFNFLLAYIVLDFVDFSIAAGNFETYLFISACFLSAVILSIVFGRIRKAD